MQVRFEEKNCEYLTYLKEIYLKNHQIDWIDCSLEHMAMYDQLFCIGRYLLGLTVVPNFDIHDTCTTNIGETPITKLMLTRVHHNASGNNHRL